MPKQIRAKLSIGLVSKREEVLEVPEESTEEEIEQIVKDWAWQYIDWSWKEA